MTWQRGVMIKKDVAVRVKCQPVLAARQGNLPGGFNLADTFGQGGGVDAGVVLTAQSHHNGDIGTVSASGFGQRTVQEHAESRHLVGGG